VTARSLLLIGGSGFFGKSFLDAHRRGLLTPWSIDRIIVVARSASALRRDHPGLVGTGVSLLDADVGTVDELPSADFVLHCAASTDARRYAENPGAERANMLAAMDNYARLAERHHRTSRIVFASSGAVYGQQPPDLPEIGEDFVPGEIAGEKREYAEAKRLCEARIAALGAEGIRTAIARCFAFVGHYLPRDQHFAIGNFLADGLAGRPIEVKARHAVYRSYMHADDLVRWLMSLADAADFDAPAYNVGSDEAVTMGELAQVVAKRFAVPAEVPAVTDLAVDRYVPSIARARAELGLELTFDLASAVDDVALRLGVQPLDQR
jgi:nucleoside-diphosphate-sugar epimerase